MKEKDNQNENLRQNDFIQEKIKSVPVNRKKLFRRTMITAIMAAMFGLIACVTFLLFQPLFSKQLLNEDDKKIENEVVFKIDEEEMSPEEMLSEYMAQEAAALQQAQEQENEPPVELPLNDEQINALLSKVMLTRENYRQIYNVLGSYVRELYHYIVSVDVVNSDKDWMNNIDQNETQYSGIIIAENGEDLLILMSNPKTIDVEELRVNFYNGFSTSAEIRGIDKSSGIMIIAVSIENLPTSMMSNGLPIATLGSSTTSIEGAPLVALGSPLGVYGSIGYGIIATPKIIVSNSDFSGNTFQTDIVGSNQSNGFIFNLSGQLIGIITDNPSTSLITAIGISDLKSRIEKLSKGEHIGYLGITGIDVTPAINAELGVPFGAYIKSIDMNSPAISSGLWTGDIIVEINDQNISNVNEYINNLQSHAIGDELTIKVLRQTQGEYKEMEFVVVVEEG